MASVRSCARPRNPSRNPITSMSKWSIPALPTPRIAALRPGQSPPLVKIPMNWDMVLCLKLIAGAGNETSQKIFPFAIGECNHMSRGNDPFLQRLLKAGFALRLPRSIGYNSRFTINHSEIGVKPRGNEKDRKRSSQSRSQKTSNACENSTSQEIAFCCFLASPNLTRLSRCWKTGFVEFGPRLLLFLEEAPCCAEHGIVTKYLSFIRCGEDGC